MELAGTLLFPCHVILYAYEWICDVSLGLPFRDRFSACLLSGCSCFTIFACFSPFIG